MTNEGMVRAVGIVAGVRAYQGGATLLEQSDHVLTGCGAHARCLFPCQLQIPSTSMDRHKHHRGILRPARVRLRLRLHLRRCFLDCC
jgi:hypothetical protein